MSSPDDGLLEPVDEPGAWVNWTRVELWKDEFILDFGFEPPGADPGREPVLIARLVCSARTLAALHEEIGRALSRYARGQIDEELGNDSSS